MPDLTQLSARSFCPFGLNSSFRHTPRTAAEPLGPCRNFEVDQMHRQDARQEDKSSGHQSHRMHSRSSLW